MTEVTLYPTSGIWRGVSEYTLWSEWKDTVTPPLWIASCCCEATEPGRWWTCRSWTVLKEHIWSVMVMPIHPNQLKNKKSLYYECVRMLLCVTSSGFQIYIATSDSAVIRQCSCSSLGCTVLTNPSMYKYTQCTCRVYVLCFFAVWYLEHYVLLEVCVYSVLVVAVQDGRSCWSFSPGLQRAYCWYL